MTKNKWKHITTLEGMSLEDRKMFSWENLHHFFRVTLWDKDHICKICHKEIERIDLATLHHIVPKNKGGVTKLMNLAITHGDCNSALNDRADLTNADPRAFRVLKRFTPKEPKVKEEKQ